MTAVSIEFSKGSFDRLRRSAQARSRVLNEDMRTTLTKTSLKVLTALRASARKSPPKRKVQEIVRGFFRQTGESRSARMQDRIQAWYEMHPESRKTGERRKLAGYIPISERRGEYKFAAIKTRKPGEAIIMPIYGATKKSEANKSKKRIIKKAGLAKSSFTWMMGKLGSGGSAPQSEISGVTGVTKTASTTDGSTTLSVKMRNDLKYILSALQGGKRDVSTALDRAREMLMSDTRRALKKAVRK
jgi:hypothetical protein